MEGRSFGTVGKMQVKGKRKRRESEEDQEHKSCSLHQGSDEEAAGQAVAGETYCLFLVHLFSPPLPLPPPHLCIYSQISLLFLHAFLFSASTLLLSPSFSTYFYSSIFISLLSFLFFHVMFHHSPLRSSSPSDAASPHLLPRHPLPYSFFVSIRCLSSSSSLSPSQSPSFTLTHCCSCYFSTFLKFSSFSFNKCKRRRCSPSGFGVVSPVICFALLVQSRCFGVV